MGPTTLLILDEKCVPCNLFGSIVNAIDLHGTLQNLSISDALQGKLIINISPMNVYDTFHLVDGEKLGSGGDALIMLIRYLIDGKVPNPNDSSSWVRHCGACIYKIISSVRRFSCHLGN